MVNAKERLPGAAPSDAATGSKAACGGHKRSNRLARWMALLGWCLCIAFMPANALANHHPWLEVRGLDGLRTAVAILLDPKESIEWEQARDSDLFQPALVKGSALASSTWYRIDIEVPNDLIGSTAWLRVTPALIWNLQWHDSSGRSGASGMSVPMSQQDHPSAPSVVEIQLDRPSIRFYVRVMSAAPRLTHLALLSDTSLQREVRLGTMVQALYLGAVGLMLLLTLLSWIYTRSALYWVFSLYLATTALFVLCVDGGINTLLLTDSPDWMARLSFASFMWVISATIVFSLFALNIPQNLPRLDKPLKMLALAIFLGSALGFNPDWITPVSAVMWPFHLVFGLALLGVSIHQAIRWRSAQSMVVCAAYLCFNLFEKYPLMAMLGWFPVDAWTTDVAKIGLISQMLLTQLQWALRLREQQALEQRALAASLEADAERTQRRDLLQFLGMFGHEVRTPLAIIHAATESLEMLPGAENEANRSRHQRIRSAVERMSILSREALSRERIEASGWKPQFSSVNMAVLIEDVLWWQQLEPPSQADGAGHYRYRLPFAVGGQPGGQLCVELDPSMPSIQADPDMLHMAIGNLVDNVRKYGFPSTDAHLRVWSRPASSEAARRCVIDVTSEGVQLTESERARVFDKYWRRAEHRNIPGAGMGLHIVKTVVQAHNASICIDSLANGQTRFRMEFPLQQDQRHQK